MPDVFISYSTTDSKFARWVHDRLSAGGVSVFLAEISLEPGDSWDAKILGNLRSADYFVFLASRKACASPIVNQEIGAAISNNKNIIPVVWDMPPTELPGFLKCNKQAFDMRGKDPLELLTVLNKVAAKVKDDKSTALFIGCALIAALLWVFGDKKK